MYLVHHIGVRFQWKPALLRNVTHGSEGREGRLKQTAATEACYKCKKKCNNNTSTKEASEEKQEQEQEQGANNSSTQNAHSLYISHPFEDTSFVTLSNSRYELADADALLGHEVQM